MKLTFVPLLHAQRELYTLPRSVERFNAYIAAMVDPATRELKVPLVAMNPMGKEHVPALLDGWIGLGADDIAARAVADAVTRLRHVPGEFHVALVLADDAKGAWTNRYFTEFGHRFDSKPLHRRGWLTGLLWTSEMPSTDAAREAALMTVYRGAYIEQHGDARTLREMIAQEGYAMANAGCRSPVLVPDDLEYTRGAITAYLDAADQPTIMTCLFGDEIASTLGYPRLGLSDHAGFAVALADARPIGPPDWPVG